jgi:hypothetical protein
VNRAKLNQEMDLRMQAAKKKEDLRKKQSEKRVKLLGNQTMNNS